MQEIQAVSSKRRWSREEVARKITDYEDAAQHVVSQRQLAQELGIPRSTLQHWLDRKNSIDVAPEVVDFFESAAGTAFLHRLVIGAHFVINMLGPCGIRLVCVFLELTGLDRFVASSYGVHQQVGMAMEKAAVEFGRQEGERLAARMVPKKITVCEDETFHPQICLVAIEAASNFILLEKYASSRKAEEWSTRLREAIHGMPVEVVQSTSDEAKGIRHHVEQDLGTHHSPDLFHIQQELVKGTSIALQARTDQAHSAVLDAQAQVESQKEAKRVYWNQEHGPGRPPEFDKRIEQAEQNELMAREKLDTAQRHQEQVTEAIHRISEVYHPYDLHSGVPRSSQELAVCLGECFSQIEAVAGQAALPERCIKKISKAKRVVVDMVATIAFFFLMVRSKVETLELSTPAQEAFLNHLLPGVYLHLCAQRAQGAEHKHRLRNLSARMLAPLRAPDSPLSTLGSEEIKQIEKVALDLAQLFQRSSSCVEGRNGQLALRHHGIHRLSDCKLEAVTVVHNYFIKRSDGTTPAQRFFGETPRDLFQRLLEKVDLPGRPAQRRPQPMPEGFLSQAVH